MKQKDLMTKIVGGLLIIFGVYKLDGVIDHYIKKYPESLISLNYGLISITLAIIIGIGAWLLIDYKKDDANP